MIQLKRIYDEPADSDGLRILVERLWPRGIRKERARVDLWLKELAPTTALRKWFGHDPERWEEFRQRYWSELEQNDDLLALLKHQVTQESVTFLYAARDEEHNSAMALKDFIDNHMS